MNEAQHLEKARQARLAGDYKAAELLCREVLDRNPVSAEASGLLGQCLAETGDIVAARRHIDLGLGLAPESADIRLNAAALKDREGDAAGAIEEALKASKLNPRKFEIWASLGNYLGKAGLFEKAAAALQNACTLNARHPGAALLLAGARLEIGNFAGVAEALDLVDAAAPDLPQSLKLRTHLARARKDPDALVAAAEKWLATGADEEEARVALAYGLALQGHYRRAADIYRPLTEQTPPAASHLAAMGRYRLGQRLIEDARSWFERAIAIDPDCAEAHFGLARIATFTGRLDDAQNLCARTAELDPTHVDALAQLVEVTGGRIDDSQFERLQGLARTLKNGDDAKAVALFALGDALQRRGQAQEAFQAWSAANAAKKLATGDAAGAIYVPQAQEAVTAKLKALFPAAGAPLKKRAFAQQGPAPIFIVGMPRSGTTLLESALSAHPLVAGGGELPALPFIFNEFLAWAQPIVGPLVHIPADMANAWRATYFRQVEDFGLARKAFLSDKQPSNFLAVGLIVELFPDAKIIHIRRNPLETGFSIFKRNFSRQWPFAHDQEQIGHYYGQHAAVMEHWAAARPSSIAFVQYESLVADFEGELRRLLAHCGLPWDDACLNAHEADRPVMTFSATQVRRAVSKDHLGAAAPYKEQLEPMRKALIAAGVDLSTGAIAARVRAPGETLH